jgi:hypothetical protein
MISLIIILFILMTVIIPGTRNYLVQQNCYVGLSSDMRKCIDFYCVGDSNALSLTVRFVHIHGACIDHVIFY